MEIPQLQIGVGGAIETSKRARLEELLLTLLVFIQSERPR